VHVEARFEIYAQSSIKAACLAVKELIGTTSAVTAGFVCRVLRKILQRLSVSAMTTAGQLQANPEVKIDIGNMTALRNSMHN
jgi:hypothetical protein